MTRGRSAAPALTAVSAIGSGRASITRRIVSGSWRRRLRSVGRRRCGSAASAGLSSRGSSGFRAARRSAGMPGFAGCIPRATRRVSRRRLSVGGNGGASCGGERSRLSGVASSLRASPSTPSVIGLHLRVCAMRRMILARADVEHQPIGRGLGVGMSESPRSRLRSSRRAPQDGSDYLFLVTVSAAVWP
jgi:hypothetical protein